MLVCLELLSRGQEVMGAGKFRTEVFDNRYENFFNVLTSIFAMLVNKLNTSRKWGLRMPTQRAVVKIR